jgi:UPF0755 protein
LISAIRIAAVGFVAFSVCSGLLILAAASQWLSAPTSPRAPERVFTVEPGEGLTRIVARLENDGLLRGRWPFGSYPLVLWARAKDLDRGIKSGEYELSPAMSPREILERLVDGEVKTHTVTVPEGFRLDEVAQRLEQAGITSAEEFLEWARNESFVRSLGIEAPTAEGYLYPETYRFQRRTPAEQVVRHMHEELLHRLTEEDRARIEASELTFHEILTLSSIVEKETSIPRERPLVAAVFWNRLRRGMRLQADPTVIYGVIDRDGTWDGNLRKRDLQDDTPYNTYVRSGLPPGPIAGVSLDSIRSVLSPEDVPYLYFVARKDGSHVFSSTLLEHNDAVRRHQIHPRRSRNGTP